MRDLAGKFRYAMRQFRLSPVFTVAAVLTLALGIGGTTAIFSLIHAVMLKSLPVSESARVTTAAWRAARRTSGAWCRFRSTKG